LLELPALEEWRAVPEVEPPPPEEEFFVPDDEPLLPLPWVAGEAHAPPTCSLLPVALSALLTATPNSLVSVC
jgi:hypothetical protein